MLGESDNDKKTACIIANTIEDDLIRRGWPAGMIYGGEVHLIERFGVGRTVVREAVRILDMRGSARMRPGPRGGLLVLPPDRDSCAATVASYIHLSTSGDGRMIHEAEAILGRVRARLLSREGSHCRGPQTDLHQIFSIAFALFGSIVADLWDIQTQGAQPHQAKRYRSRAEIIARMILNEYPREDWVSGIRIGSAGELCERYRADSSVMDQAIRILESGELAVSEPGRGRGLRSRMPGPAVVCRLVNCHFAARGLTSSDAMTLFRAFAEEATVSVVACVGREDIERFAAALDALDAADSGTAPEVLRAAEASQFAALNNPLIDFFLLCTRVYSTYFIGEHGHCREADAAYLAGAREVLTAIASRDRDRALIAERCKQSRLALALAEPWATPQST
jgi:DNA-binding FadR family transcriptional regulator